MKSLSRRDFLRMSAGVAGVTLLSACGMPGENPNCGTPVESSRGTEATTSEGYLYYLQIGGPAVAEIIQTKVYKSGLVVYSGNLHIEVSDSGSNTILHTRDGGPSKITRGVLTENQGFIIVGTNLKDELIGEGDELLIPEGSVVVFGQGYNGSTMPSLLQIEDSTQKDTDFYMQNLEKALIEGQK